jgi:hypothetical protein
MPPSLPPWLPGALAMSVLGQILGAKIGSGAISAVAAGLMPLALVAAATRVNRTAHSGDAMAADALVDTARQNAWLQAAAWGAGAASMFGVYLLSGLKWQHGWQYGLGMAVIALAAVIYARQPRFLQATMIVVAMQGAAAAVGLAILAGSGKLASVKGDWAANIIFVAGGVAIAVLSVLAVAAFRHAQSAAVSADNAAQT